MNKNHEYKCARQFIKTHKIRELSRESLERAAKSLGFCIIYFDNEQDTNKFAKFLKTDALKYKFKSCTPFTYYDQNNRIIFMPDNISDEEIVISLCREIGYIVMKDYYPPERNQSILVCDSAGEFAHYLKEMTKSTLKSRFLRSPLAFMLSSGTSLFLIFCVSIMLSFSVGTVYDNSGLNFDNLLNSDVQDTNFFDDGVEASAPLEIPSVSLDEMFDNHNSNHISDVQSTSDNFFYATKTGKKYHKSECIYVSGKENLVEIPKDNIDTSKYEPCSKCIMK